MSTIAFEWSDRELVQGMLAGSALAWRAFARNYDALIYAAIDRVLRPFPTLNNRGEREDVHATLLSSLVARDMHKLRVFQLERGVRLSTWIHLLASNAARDYLRAARSRLAIQRAAAAQDAPEEQAPSPFSALLAKESLSRMAAVLAAFSVRDRQLVDLLLVQRRSPEQVALAMNISVKTVYTKKHKLAHRLRGAMAEPNNMTRLPLRKVSAQDHGFGELVAI